MSEAVDAFRTRLSEQYLAGIGLPEPFLFFSGEPVRPVPPQEVATGGVLILGAYPTAHFEMHDEQVTPVRNIDRPLAEDTVSGKTLQAHYFKPLGLTREKCWVTNLVKMFLFKEGHQLAPGVKLPSLLKRKSFDAVAMSEANLAFLDEELQLADPKLVITLGIEVAGVLRGKKTLKDRNALLSGQLASFTLKDRSYNAIHLVHPGILLRRTGGTRNPWPHAHETQHLPAAREVLRQLRLLD